MKNIKPHIKNSNKYESYKSGAVKLMIAGLIVRLFGFVNRIYMSNLIGAEGMGLYQLTFPVYSLIILTLTSGVSITVSGMAAKERALGHAKGARRVAKAAFYLLLFAGSIAALAMIIFGKQISSAILGDSRTYLSLILLAPCIPIVASASAIKGYFYGMAKVTPTAISQIVEQIARILFIVIFAQKIAGTNLTYACAILTISSAVGEMANLAVVSVAFFKYSKEDGHSGKMTFSELTKTSGYIAKQAAPISLNRFIVSVMGTIETIILPLRFIAGGLNYQSSLAMLGRLSGMAMPLIMFPTIVTSSLSTTLVPAISGALAAGNRRLAQQRISRCIRISCLMGFFFFGFFATFGNQIGDMLYPGQNTGNLLQKLAVYCIIVYLQQTMTGILNGLGKHGFSLFSTSTGYVIRMSFIWFTVPIKGVDGYIAGMLISSAVTAIINLVYIVKNIGIQIEFTEWFIKPLCVGLAINISGTFLVSARIFSAQYGWIIVCGISCLLSLSLALITKTIKLTDFKNGKLRSVG